MVSSIVVSVNIIMAVVRIVIIHVHYCHTIWRCTLCNTFSRVNLFVCVSMSVRVVAVECLDLETSIKTCRYVFRISTATCNVVTS